MGIFLRKCVAILILSIGFSANLSAMQGLIADSYNSYKQKYSINVMWINEKFKKDQKFIHPSIDEFTPVISKWAVLNKSSVVNVWYDSALSTPDAIRNTEKVIQKKCLGNPLIAFILKPFMAPIRLKDVRDLPEVKEHSALFSDSRIPVYFRVDLLRAIAGHNDISCGKTDYFVYSDLDVKPMTEKQLFDEKTKQNLKQYGMVMAYSKRHDFENSFQIISNHKPNLLEAKKFALIDLNIERAYNAQQGKLSNALRRQPKGPFEPLEQIAYDSYRPMFEYFYHLEGCGSCFAPRFQNGHFTDEIYDKKLDGLKPFGPQSLGDRTISFKAKDDWCKRKKYYEDTSCEVTFIPTKEVNVPPSHFG